MAEAEQEKQAKTEKFPEFKPGDTIKVGWEIREGEKTRVQPFEGIVIARKGKADFKTVTVRRIASDRIGVERIFPLNSPRLKTLELIKSGQVRRAKLYYLRGREGKQALKVKSAKV